MNDKQYARFKDAPWLPQKEIPCIIGGAGGIGGWLALLLSRATFTVSIFDDDTFEEHNMSGQMVMTEHIGKSKVDTVKDIVKSFTNSTIATYFQRVDENCFYGPYMFSCFDNMKARKDFFNAWKKYVRWWGTREELKKEIPIFIDGRLTAEQLQIFCVTPDNIEKFEKEFLPEDSEVPDTPCTFKQTTHMATMISSFMTGFFTNHLVNMEDKSRIVPLKFEYFLPINYISSL